MRDAPTEATLAEGGRGGVPCSAASAKGGAWLLGRLAGSLGGGRGFETFDIAGPGALLEFVCCGDSCIVSIAGNPCALLASCRPSGLGVGAVKLGRAAKLAAFIGSLESSLPAGAIPAKPRPFKAAIRSLSEVYVGSGSSSLGFNAIARDVAW